MNNKHRRLEVFIEFLVFGILIGVVEDLIAVTLVTGETPDIRVFGIVVLVAIPFAFIGEVVIDKIDFIAAWNKFFKKRKSR